MKIYRLNDLEWWMANSLEEAIQTAIKETGAAREDIFTEDGSPEPLTDEQLDRLQFVDTNPESGDPSAELGKRSFREQLARELAAGAGPGIFASSEW
jgi:hypothetical protein